LHELVQAAVPQGKSGRGQAPGYAADDQWSQDFKPQRQAIAGGEKAVNGGQDEVMDVE